MSTIRKVLLVLLAAGLTAVMLLTWGSVGSILMCFCLIAMGATLLYQRFLVNNDDSDFQMEV